MTATARDVEAVQRHTIRVLVVAQVFGALGMTIGFATAALLARDISGSDTQSGLVQTCQVLGAAVAVFTWQVRRWTTVLWFALLMSHGE